MRAAVALLLVACAVPELAQPNTVQACDRALACSAIALEQHDQCVVCLEHVDQAKLDALQEKLGDLPEIESWTCEQVSQVIQYTDIGDCISDGWVYDK